MGDVYKRRGDRAFVVFRVTRAVAVYDDCDYFRSLASWYDHGPGLYKPHIHITLWPEELCHLWRGVVSLGHPVDPLVDWLIEFGPANLRAELERWVGNSPG